MGFGVGFAVAGPNHDLGCVRSAEAGGQRPSGATAMDARFSEEVSHRPLRAGDALVWLRVRPESGAEAPVFATLYVGADHKVFRRTDTLDMVVDGEILQGAYRPGPADLGPGSRRFSLLPTVHGGPERLVFTEDAATSFRWSGRVLRSVGPYLFVERERVAQGLSVQTSVEVLDVRSASWEESTGALWAESPSLKPLQDQVDLWRSPSGSSAEEPSTFGSYVANLRATCQHLASGSTVFSAVPALEITTEYNELGLLRVGQRARAGECSGALFHEETWLRMPASPTVELTQIPEAFEPWARMPSAVYERVRQLPEGVFGGYTTVP
jgi:hypothetical protein